MGSRRPGLEDDAEDADEAKIDRSITARAWIALSDVASHAFTLFA